MGCFRRRGRRTLSQLKDCGDKFSLSDHRGDLLWMRNECSLSRACFELWYTHLRHLRHPFADQIPKAQATRRKKGGNVRWLCSLSSSCALGAFVQSDVDDVVHQVRGGHGASRRVAKKSPAAPSCMRWGGGDIGRWNQTVLL